MEELIEEQIRSLVTVCHFQLYSFPLAAITTYDTLRGSHHKHVILSVLEFVSLRWV